MYTFLQELIHAWLNSHSSGVINTLSMQHYVMVCYFAANMEYYSTPRTVIDGLQDDVRRQRKLWHNSYTTHCSWHKWRAFHASCNFLWHCKYYAHNSEGWLINESMRTHKLNMQMLRWGISQKNALIVSKWTLEFFFSFQLCFQGHYTNTNH